MNPSDYTPPTIWEPPSDSGGKFGSINQPIAGARHSQPLPCGQAPLQLYSLNTPNGIKVNILLEELAELNIQGAKFDAHQIDIMAGDQFGDGFVAINPNSKIPALIDQTDAKAPIHLFESGAIVWYLAEKFAQFIPPMSAGNARADCLSWVMWQMGSAPYLGGGFGHFYAYAPKPMRYPIDRFTLEVKRQLDLLNQHLAKREYISWVADTTNPNGEYSIADMMIWPWYGQLVLGKLYDAGTFLQVQDYPNVQRWAQTLAQRPAVDRALTLPLST